MDKKVCGGQHGIAKHLYIEKSHCNDVLVIVGLQSRPYSIKLRLDAFSGPLTNFTRLKRIY